jgi:hypothetical protein
MNLPDTWYDRMKARIAELLPEAIPDEVICEIIKEQVPHLLTQKTARGRYGQEEQPIINEMIVPVLKQITQEHIEQYFRENPDAIAAAIQVKIDEAIRQGLGKMIAEVFLGQIGKSTQP